MKIFGFRIGTEGDRAFPEQNARAARFALLVHATLLMADKRTMSAFVREGRQCPRLGETEEEGLLP